MVDINNPNYDWVKLGSLWVYKDEQQPWVKVRIDFVPDRPINAFLVGPNCQNMGSSYRSYYYLDNFSLTEEANLAYKTIQVDTLGCTAGFRLHAPPAQGATYQWYKEGIALASATAPTLSVPAQTSASGTYSVRLQFATHCLIASDVSLLIRDVSGLRIGKDTVLCLGDSLLLRSNLQHPPEEGMQSGIRYRWHNGSTDTILQVKTAGRYTLTATNEAGCTATASVTVAYQGCVNCKLYVPTAFTPNGDGRNDTWRVAAQCPPQHYRMRVYNRWGALVFESGEPGRLWDGTYRGTPLPVGVYVYQAQWRSPGDRKNLQTESGSVVLIR